MAHYLVVDRSGDVPVITSVEGKNLQAVVDSLKLGDGQSVEVFRVAAPARTVSVKTETVRRVVIGKGRK